MGLLSPIIVRRIGVEKFQIISGHRRKEALSSLGYDKADCDIVEMTDEQAYRALMTANIQSQSLSEIEEAEGIKHMMDVYEWNQDRVAKEFGKTQNWISMRLGLLKLDESVQEMIIARAINPSQARYISSLPEEKQREVAQKVSDEQLSKRETAELVRQINNPHKEDTSTDIEIQTEPHKDIMSISESMSEKYEFHTLEDNSDMVNHHDRSNVKAEQNVNFEFSPADLKDEVSDLEVIRIPRVKTEFELFEEQIGPGSDFILLIKNFFIDVQPNERTINSLVQFNKVDESVACIDKLTNMLGMIRTKIINSKNCTGTQIGEGNIVEFRKKEA